MTEQHMVQLLQRRGVTVEQISEIVFKLQKPYNDQLSPEECIESVMAVLAKREVQYTLYTGIALDELAEKSCCPSLCNRFLKRMNLCSASTKH